MSTDDPNPNERSATEGEFEASPRVGTALIDGATFVAKPVQYVVIDGLAILEGDIVLGTVEEVERATQARQEALRRGDALAHGVAISGSQFRWPNCVIPYVIDDDLPNQSRVTDAIAHWEEHTDLRFVERTQANASQHPDYVRFRQGTGCSAHVGRRQIGEQHVNLANGCSLGNTIHEIGHVAGLWHEQSREDRDCFVTIHWDNITQGAEHNFNQHISDGDDIGRYDYGSVMHYPKWAFSKNGNDTITPNAKGVVEIGQRDGLSEGDILAIAQMYPSCNKSKFSDDPKSKVIDDPKTKVIDDQHPKRLSDHKLKVLDDGKGQPHLERPAPPLPGLRRSPFGLATPHHAPSVAGTASRQPDELAGHLERLEELLAASERHLADLRAIAGHATGRASEASEAHEQLLAAYEQARAAAQSAGRGGA